MADDPLKIAVVEEDGSWYVSLWYSAAEAVRTDAGETALPVIGGGPAPVGAESPEAALEGLIENIAALDAEGVLTLLDPEEARVLYDYSNLFLPESGIVHRRTQGRRRGRWRYVVGGGRRDRGGRGQWPDSRHPDVVHAAMSGPDIDMQMTLTGNCVTTVSDGATEEFCPEDVEELGFGGLGGLVGTDLWKADLTVVERDGRWYVSLVPSMLYRVNDVLVEMEPADIEAMIDDFEELVSSAFGMGMGLTVRFRRGQVSIRRRRSPSRTPAAAMPTIPRTRQWCRRAPTRGGRILSSPTSPSPRST